MKTPIKITAGLLLLTWLTGCIVTSVYPFYTAKDVVFDPALVGAWAEKDTTNAANEHWRFAKGEENAYVLTVQDKDKRTEFDARLFQLKGQLFFDFYSRERTENSLPVHYLLKVNRTEPTLEMSLMNYDWLKKLIKKNPKAIRHMWAPQKPGESGDDDGELVLTADTAELQRFILKQAKAEEAFSEFVVMKRWTP